MKTFMNITSPVARLTSLLLILSALSSCAGTDSVSSKVAFDHLENLEETWSELEAEPHAKAGFDQAVQQFDEFRNPNGEYEDERIPYSAERVEAARLIERLMAGAISSQVPPVPDRVISRKLWIAKNFRRMFEAAGPDPVDGED